MKRFPFYLMATALLLALATPVYAASDIDSDADKKADARMRANLGKQLNALLDSPIKAIQEQALQNIIYYASTCPDDVDLGRTVPTLLDLYENDDREAIRIMALSALDAIGDESALEQMADHLRYEWSPRVRQLTRIALIQHRIL